MLSSGRGSGPVVLDWLRRRPDHRPGGIWLGFEPVAGELADLAQRGDGGLEVALLFLEQTEPFLDLADEQRHLGGLRMRGVKAEVIGDVAQREAEPLAAQYQDQPGPVAPSEDAGAADPLGGEQPLGFVEADGAGRNAEFAGEIGDGEQIARLGSGPVHFVPAFMAVYSSRSSFLDNLPIRVFGSWSLNTISRGSSSLLTWAERNCFSSCGVTVAPAFSLTKATGASPRYSSGTPMTLASSTASCR